VHVQIQLHRPFMLFEMLKAEQAEQRFEIDFREFETEQSAPVSRQKASPREAIDHCK
jgi:hypothetical protein